VQAVLVPRCTLILNGSYDSPLAKKRPKKCQPDNRVGGMIHAGGDGSNEDIRMLADRTPRVRRAAMVAKVGGVFGL
jgi:hypothetical protein